MSPPTTSTVQSANARPLAADPVPPGYYIQWAGRSALKSAEQRLRVVIPFTLIIIFVSSPQHEVLVARTAIVLLAVPFSLVGAFWPPLPPLHYNLSGAVWVGLIALAGLDAETGVVMLLYLDHAWDKFQAAGRMNSPGDLHDAILEGAVQRIRPKIMTVCAILFGLLPIMWSPTTQAGRRCHEAHRCPDDRRSGDLGDLGTPAVPDDLHALETEAPPEPAKRAGAGLSPFGVAWLRNPIP